MGGYSSEYQISLKSGNTVYKHLDRKKYTPYRIHIFKNKWVYVDDDENEYPVNRHDFSVKTEKEHIVFDGAFNAIHGSPGENGYLQAYFDLLGLPQTSCGFYQSALTFNKRDTLAVLKPYGIKTAISYYVNRGDIINEDAIISKVGLPCFVKANRSGSSFGISKVHEKSALKKAIDMAYEEDDEIIIESFLDGREVSVGVITYHGKAIALPITEITTENDFFDYEAKYLGQSKETTPAILPEGWSEKVAALAVRIYTLLKMQGFSRSEFIFVDGEPHLLEINTVPGLTDASLLPQQAREAGISLADLFGNAIEMALNNYEKIK